MRMCIGGRHICVNVCEFADTVVAFRLNGTHPKFTTELCTLSDQAMRLIPGIRPTAQHRHIHKQPSEAGRQVGGRIVGMSGDMRTHIA